MAVNLKRLLAALELFIFGIVFSESLFFHKIHDHVSPLEQRCPFNFGDVREVFQKSIQHCSAKLFVRKLPPAKENCGFHLVSRFQKFARVLHLKIVIMLFDFGAQADFFDIDYGLFFLVGLLLFAQLIFIFAEIHDLAHGRIGFWCDFDKIKPCAFGKTKRIINRFDADLLAFTVDQANGS